MHNIEVDNSKTVGIYLGSSMGNNPIFKDAIIELAKGLVKYKYSVIYGGGGTGLMGLLAETIKSHDGKVVGITTEHLAKIEKPYDYLDELHIVDSMYERKKMIHEKSSLFIAMPGGVGTFDELFETWCAIKIGTIKKPFGLVNINGYFNPMLNFVKSSMRYGFLDQKDVHIPNIYNNVSECLQYLEEKDLTLNLLEESMI